LNLLSKEVFAKITHAFVQSEADAFEFTYQGTLTPGALKISTFSGDWCDGNWINSPQDGYELSNTDYIITNGCDGPDNKWTVTSSTQGAYIITVNLYDETIKFLFNNIPNYQKSGKLAIRTGLTNIKILANYFNNPQNLDEKSELNE